MHRFFNALVYHAWQSQACEQKDPPTGLGVQHLETTRVARRAMGLMAAGGRGFPLQPPTPECAPLPKRGVPRLEPTGAPLVPGVCVGKLARFMTTFTS